MQLPQENKWVEGKLNCVKSQLSQNSEFEKLLTSLIDGALSRDTGDALTKLDRYMRELYEEGHKLVVSEWFVGFLIGNHIFESYGETVLQFYPVMGSQNREDLFAFFSDLSAICLPSHRELFANMVDKKCKVSLPRRNWSASTWPELLSHVIPSSNNGTPLFLIIKEVAQDWAKSEIAKRRSEMQTPFSLFSVRSFPKPEAPLKIDKAISNCTSSAP